MVNKSKSKIVVYSKRTPINYTESKFTLQRKSETCLFTCLSVSLTSGEVNQVQLSFPEVLVATWIGVADLEQGPSMITS